VLVAFLGSYKFLLYLFFWQAARRWKKNEPRDERRHSVKVATAGELRTARADTVAGMFFFELHHVFHYSNTPPLCMRTGRPASPRPGSRRSSASSGRDGAYLPLRWG